MFIEILQVLLVIVIFILIKWICYKITEVWGLPTFLDYMPYSCRKCLSFWSLTACFIACGLLLHLWITMAVGCVLTVLDTIAVIVDQRKKTIHLDI